MDGVTEAFDRFDFALGLEITETSFWFFTDNYIELVKGRVYGSRTDSARESAHAALLLAIETYLKLFAPHIPFVSEEIWTWRREGSVHRSAWPNAEAIRARAGKTSNGVVYEMASKVLGEIRRFKSDSDVSLRAQVAKVVVRDTAEHLQILRESLQDIKDAGCVAELMTVADDMFSVSVTLDRAAAR